MGNKRRQRAVIEMTEGSNFFRPVIDKHATDFEHRFDGYKIPDEYFDDFVGYTSSSIPPASLPITMGFTGRGFAIGNFTDRNHVPCSIQRSSLMDEPLIWLGCNEANPKECIKGRGWVPVKMPEEYLVNTRMHLNQKQAAELITVLQRFVDTGKIYEQESE